MTATQRYARTEQRMKPWVIGKDGPLDVPALVRREPTIRSIGGGYGFTLRILNDGHHWEFKRDGLLIEWWPSTGRIAVNKRFNRGDKLFSVDALRGLLTKESEKAQ